MGIAFGVFNAGITLGYFFVAVVVLPHIAVRRRWVRVAAVLFFVTCGITHADMAVHGLYDYWPAGVEMHAFVTHAVQVVSVWAFVIGIYLEFVSDPKKRSAGSR